LIGLQWKESIDTHPHTQVHTHTHTGRHIRPVNLLAQLKPVTDIGSYLVNC